MVNQGARLTPEEKKVLIALNREKYGLSEEEVAEIRLPAPCHLVQVYDIDKIMNPRLKLSTIEKINHCKKLENALKSKLEMIKNKTLVVHNPLSTSQVSRRGRPAMAKSSQMMRVVGV